MSPLGAVKAAAGEGRTHICATTGWEIAECKCLHAAVTSAAAHTKCHIRTRTTSGCKLSSDLERDRRTDARRDGGDCAPVRTCVCVCVRASG